MELSKSLEDALNDQINAELYSAYLYLSMSAYCEAMNLPGFAHWMRLQQDEEQEHAMKIFDFVNDRGGRVTLKSVDQPPSDFRSPLDIMERALEHERSVTSMIGSLYDLAAEEKDYSAHVMLEWFVSEQVQEEKAASQIVERLRMVEGDGVGLSMIDATLGERQAQAPAE